MSTSLIYHALRVHGCLYVCSFYKKAKYIFIQGIILEKSNVPIVTAARLS